MNRVLLGTNLLIYAIDEDSKYFDSVQELINNDTLKLFTTSKNLSEFLSVNGNTVISIINWSFY